MPAMALVIRRRTLVRVAIFAALGLFIKVFFAPRSDPKSVAAFYSTGDPYEIRKQNVLDFVTGADKQLDARKLQFLQARVGRDERPDIFSGVIDDGVQDYWERFQKP